MVPNSIQKIHEAALQISREFRSCESRLVEVLGQVDENEVFRHLGYPSLFRYSVEALGLTEAVAYALIQVARTVKQVPELKKEVENGALSVFKAKKICSLLKRDEPVQNQIWIEKAKSMSSRELEREVLKIKEPEVRTLRLQISPELLRDLERCQELVSQSESHVVSLEETLGALVKTYLKTKDPLEKAKRQAEKALKPVASGERVSAPERVTGTARSPIPAAQKHREVLRNQAQCTHIDSNGKRCPEKRFLHFHHQQPVSLGGTHIADNLQLLCSSHHRLLHWQETRSPEKKAARL